MPTSKALNFVHHAPGNVVKVPSEAAIVELIERITGAGIELEGNSKLTAMFGREDAPLLARTKSSKVTYIGAASRRRGAPLP